jgi:hypothetical protein
MLKIMNILLFGIWEMPVTNYLYFYLLAGLVGFILCYFNRYLLPLVAIALLWFSITDFTYFYHIINLRPDNSYIFKATLSMIFAILASVVGAIVNLKKVRALK